MSHCHSQHQNSLVTSSASSLIQHHESSQHRRPLKGHRTFCSSFLMMWASVHLRALVDQSQRQVSTKLLSRDFFTTSSTPQPFARQPGPRCSQEEITTRCTWVASQKLQTHFLVTTAPFHQKLQLLRRSYSSPVTQPHVLGNGT